MRKWDISLNTQMNVIKRAIVHIEMTFLLLPSCSVFFTSLSRVVDPYDAGAFPLAAYDDYNRAVQTQSDGLTANAVEVRLSARLPGNHYSLVLSCSHTLTSNTSHTSL